MRHGLINFKKYILCDLEQDKKEGYEMRQLYFSIIYEDKAVVMMA